MQAMIGALRRYAWGSTTFIPDLLGRSADGTAQAELWLGAHPTAPSMIGADALGDLINADPRRVVGGAVVDRFGPRLPYLMKVLAANQPLSLQVHPDRVQATNGYHREQAAGLATTDELRLYRDDWPKPEMLCALTTLDALCGFRDPARTHQLFTQLGATSTTSLVERLARADGDPIRCVLAEVLRLGASAHAMITDLVRLSEPVVVAPAGLDLDLIDFCRTLVDLHRAFPGDPGILAALMLNRVTIEPGQALYLPPCTPHAYLRGAGVEIMANSDNVLRGGLTNKPIAVDELLAIIDTTPGPPHIVRTVAESPGVVRYHTPAPEFSLWKLSIGSDPIRVPRSDAGRILLVADGWARLDGAGTTTTTMCRGDSAFAYPDDDLRVHGAGTIFLAAPGI